MSIAPVTREQEQMLNRSGIRWEGSRGPMGGGGPLNLNFLTRQFNQGGQQPYGGGPQGSRNPWMNRPQQASQSTWNDPRRMARDPRLQRGAHPMQQQAGASPYQNALMQRFSMPSWAPQTQGYRTGSSYTQGQGPRYAPPPSPQQQWGQGVQNAFARFGFGGRQPQQPTAPRTMGKPMGRQGRMY